LKKPLNIAINCRVLLPKRMEGIARYIFETSLRIIKNNPNDNFFLIFDRAVDSSLKSLFPSNAKFLIAHPQARHPILFYLWFEHALPRLFKKYKIDLFYTPESFLSLKSKVPTLMVTHDIAFETYPDHLPKRMQTYLLKNGPKFHLRADHVIAVSEFTRHDIIKNYGLSPSKISVAGNACPEGFNPIKEVDKQEVRKKYTNGDKFLLYVGAIHPRKNVDRLIDAFTQFNKEKKYTLLLIGRMAWHTAEITKRIEGDSKVRYLSNIGSELKTIMAAAELLCYVSLYEGFGIPILEAMSCEVPVLTSENSSMSEVGGEAAFYVDPRSIQSITEGISTLINDDNLKASLLSLGKDRVKDFSWDITTEKITTQLMRLL